MPAADAIRWLSWSGDAFARARAERKPVLLSIVASWCRNCHEMDRTSYRDARVVRLVQDAFVPIRVDSDRHPDISHRYSLGGWPTTAFLTEVGEILGGGTYVDAERLSDTLQRVHAAYAERRHVRASAPPYDEDASQPDEPVDRLMNRIDAAFDPVHGGYGDAPKFPHVAPVRLALDIYAATGSEQARAMAVKSLDAMGWGPLYDETDGGFFRYAHGADWSGPNQEKLLDVNASLLALYIHAFETLQLARYGERAEDILRYVQTWLADPVDGAWAGSQRADPGYYAHSERSAVAPDDMPPIDRTLFADWNGMMASAALQAGRVMGDSALSGFAIKSLERIVLLCYRPGTGAAHYYDGQAARRGLLDDQVALAAAHLDAFEATGNIVYEMMAEELALFAARTMWDGDAGGFFDRVGAGDDVGLLRRPVKSFGANCAAVRLLRRLAATSGNRAFHDYADRTLQAMAPRAPQQGPLAAEYVLAVRASAQ
jgi:uncharacterized protein YyaL (SSP411 family)